MVKYRGGWSYPAPPKRLKLLNRTVKVEPMTAAEHAESNAIGVAHRGQNVITMHPHMPQDNAQDTLLHEALHYLWADLFQGETPPEEKCVSLLSTGLINVMQRNPKLVEWLMAPLERE